jgi:hypothetical protein
MIGSLINYLKRSGMKGAKYSNSKPSGDFHGSIPALNRTLKTLNFER